MSAQCIELEGTVIDSCRGVATVAVRVGNQTLTVKAKLAGRLFLRRVHIAIGDSVVVQVSPFDPLKGRIVERLTNAKPEWKRKA